MIRHYISKLNSFIIRKTVKYIVWDFDGTLYENKKLGRDLQSAFFDIAKNKDKNLTQKSFNIATEKFGSWSAAAAQLSSIPELKVLDIVDSKINKAIYLKKNLTLVKQIESTQNQYHHLILTNSTTAEVISCLKKIGFNTDKKPTGPFEKIFGRDSTRLLKPNLKIYNKILAYTKAPKFTHLFIGDSLNHDINPARLSGFQALPIWEINKIFKH
ncbi:MAG: HAD family hydrolase [Candidatus Shapirobacteria bacterium]